MGALATAGPARLAAVVEDDADVLDVLADVLREELGVAVEKWGSGRDFVASLRDHLPDLIILDLMMPPPTGWDVLRLLDTRPEWRRIPIVAISAMRDPAKHVPAGRCAAVLAKPFPTDDLLRVVRGALDPGQTSPSSRSRR